jgi:hypothetical protein
MTPKKKADEPQEEEDLRQQKEAPEQQKQPLSGADAPQTETTTFPQNPVDIRAPIESTHNRTRDDREKQYVSDRVALEADYHSDLADINQTKRDALAAAGLNPDGGTPSDYTPS